MPAIVREHFRLRETIATISAYDLRHIEAAKESIREQRRLLEGFIVSDPFFMTTLDPYDLVGDAPEIVVQMVAASSLFGIGPMAAVAGAIAKFAVQAMIDAGAVYAVVDNGGDMSIVNDRPVLIGIYAGESAIKDVALQIPPRDVPLGVCTSSGTVGPSISFGFADAALVISDDPALADAGATALGNAVPLEGPIDDAFEVVKRPGVRGALVIRGDKMALWGELPPLCRAHLRPDLITRA